MKKSLVFLFLFIPIVTKTVIEMECLALQNNEETDKKLIITDQTQLSGMAQVGEWKVLFRISETEIDDVSYDVATILKTPDDGERQILNGVGKFRNKHGLRFDYQNRQLNIAISHKNDADM